jgi:hypothetical protein
MKNLNLFSVRVLMKALSSVSTLILAASLSACGGGSSASPAAVGVSSPDRGAKANEVTDAFGPLIVREGQFDAQADHKPWSGSWLPIKSDYLFAPSDRGPAPLQKYDTYMKNAHGQDSHAADYERTNPELYDPNALGWEGRCDAWAAASVLAPEPTHRVTLNDVEFSVGDLKALLIKSYENTPALKQFGKNFEPGPDADFNKMYPDQFQRAVQHEVFEHHRLMVFDNDPSEQVWNTPLYRAEFDIKADAHDEHTMHVTAYIRGVSPFIPNLDFVGTITVNYIYTYDLYGDKQGDGSFKVSYGEWTGDSRTNHPNFVSVINTDTHHQSNNIDLDTNIVNEIVSKGL